jgi:hypothetical protein
MEQVFKKLLDQSVKNLVALEGRGLIEFKIFTIDGEEFGKMKAVKPKSKKKKKASAYPYGEIRQYLLPILSNVKPDEVVSIPIGKYDAETVRGNACSWCTGAWGSATYKSVVNKDKKTVEIYRFPQ